jgi:hypothetical protein
MKGDWEVETRRRLSRRPVRHEPECAGRDRGQLARTGNALATADGGGSTDEARRIGLVVASNTR